MRNAAVALASLGALAACNPSAPGGESGGGLFPNLFQTAYRAEAVASAGEEGATMPVVMIRDGQNMRMEMTTPEGQMAVITNGATGESFIVTTQGGQTVAMRASAGQGQELPIDEWSQELSQNATRTGACSAAGQNGSEWTTTEEDGQVSTACVTDDGIILRATENGQTTWETTRVQRGPQNPALFAVPEGAQVIDLGSMIGGQ